MSGLGHQIKTPGSLKSMPKEKLEKDYQNFMDQIERSADEGFKSIKEKAEAVKAEANLVGEAVEVSVHENERKNKEKG
jgi:hypothetical protein